MIAKGKIQRDGTVYMLANFTITDKTSYGRYIEGFFSILARHHGELLSVQDERDTLEGESIPGRMVLFTFPSERHARDWYSDPEYQSISEFRRAGTANGSLQMMRAGILSP